MKLIENLRFIFALTVFFSFVSSCAAESGSTFPDVNNAQVGNDSAGTNVTADVAETGQDMTRSGNADEGISNIEEFSCTEEASMELYDRRIAPLVSGEIPSSCNQCHLSGVELSMFVQATPCETLGCLASLELVDLENPEESSILAQIKMAEPDSKLITAEVLQEEYDGFLEWIQYGSQCFDEVCGEIEKGCNAPAAFVPVADGVMSPLGVCTEPGLVAFFEQKVFADRKRCQGCHGLESNHAENPPFWLDTTFNEFDPASMTKSATYSMYNLIGLGAINTEYPESSTMLCRHLAVEWGGCGPGNHIKFQNKGDPTYTNFLEWVELYASCFDQQ